MEATNHTKYRVGNMNSAILRAKNGTGCQEEAHHRKTRHRKTHHRKIRHRKFRHRKPWYTIHTRHKGTNAHVTQISHNALPSSTSPVVQRDERSSWRCANKVGPEPTHKKRIRRGYRSEASMLQKKTERKEKRRRARAQYRQVRQRWNFLAKTPAKLNLAQERILADILLEDMQTKQCHLHQSDDSLKTTEKALKIATFNVKGLNFASGRQGGSNLCTSWQNITLTLSRFRKPM